MLFLQGRMATAQSFGEMKMNPGIFFEEKIAAGLQANVSKAQEINAIYQFCLSGDEGGDWTLDLKVPEVRVGLDEGADCTVHMETSDFMDMVSGKLPGPAAFMQGKLRLDGDIALAMKLQELFAMQA